MNLHLHLSGKAGELLYASGSLPAIRRRWPGAHVILHLHPHYIPIVEQLRHRPDAVEPYPVPDPSRPLALQVTDCLRVAHRLHRNHPITRDVDGDWHVLLYGLHQANGDVTWRARSWTQPLTFWQLFLAAADAEVNGWEHPFWGFPWPDRAYKVLVLASGNLHTGGARSIDLPPAEWECLAAEIRAQGYYPQATGHRDDPRPSMPGWDWLETDDPREVLAALQQCIAVLGLNSGMTWAACQIAPGLVTMLDTQGRPEYIFEWGYASGALDPARHLQVPWATAAEDMIGTVRRALLR